MLYPARWKNITVDQSKVQKKSTIPFFGGPPGITTLYTNWVPSIVMYLWLYECEGNNSSLLLKSSGHVEMDCYASQRRIYSMQDKGITSTITKLFLMAAILSGVRAGWKSSFSLWHSTIVLLSCKTKRVDWAGMQGKYITVSCDAKQLLVGVVYRVAQKERNGILPVIKI